MSFLFFILLIGPLIFVHELGHFLAARAIGVGVTRFSIGFGPRIAGFRRGETEYVIGILPLGGYVRLVGSDPAEVSDLDNRDRSRALLSKPIWKRMIVLLAGPLANLLLPLPILMAYYWAEDARMPARVGTVQEESPADRAGLEPGDTIVSIDGDEIRFFDQLQGAIGSAQDREVELRIERDDEVFSTRLRPIRERSFDPWVRIRTVERSIIGVTASYFGPIIAIEDPDGPAARSGLMTFDRIVRIGEYSISSYLEFEEVLTQLEGPSDVLLFRPFPVGGNIGQLFVEQPVHLTLPSMESYSAQDLGLESANMVIRTVQPQSPAHQAGLRPGDRILAVDGRSYNIFSSVLKTLHEPPLTTHEVAYRRGGQTSTALLTPIEMEVTGDFKQEVNQTFVGMRSLDTGEFYPPAVSYFPLLPMSAGERVVYGIAMGFKALIGFILGIIVGVWQIITRDVGLDSLGGPIMIFDIAGRAGQAGLGTFMRMMGLISINLGILNLLPIPVLDGGSLMMFSIEGIMRRPLTARVRQIATYVGLVFILLLFLMVFKNDIERYWADFVEFFN